MGKRKRRIFKSYGELEGALREYLKEIIQYHTDRTVTQHAQFIKLGDDRIRVYIYTPEHRYSIVATMNGYLGCQASTRKPRAGENWNRGNDLPDGPFNRKTWESIKKSIIGYELEPLSTEILSRLELQGVDTGDEKAKELAKFRKEQEERLKDVEPKEEAGEP